MSADNWTLADLRQCNVDRQAAWCPDQVPDLSFRGNELAGEVGEACSVIKKLERERQGWRGSRATREQLAEELADVVICADLAALTADVDLMDAVKAKFDATSDKVGLPHRLAPAPSPAALPSQTSGAEGEVVAWRFRYRDGKLWNFSQDPAYIVELNADVFVIEPLYALAKPASEPAGGGAREAEVAQWKRDSELLSAIQNECWDVRFTSSPNADAGDYNINIEIVGHFMAEPQERVVGENHDEDLRAALEQAMTAEAYPPARPDYDQPAAMSAPAPEQEEL